MSIQIVNPLDRPSWDDLVLSTPNYSFFHSSAWARVLSESYGYTPLYFTVIENDKLRVLVPMMEVNSFLTGKRGVSLPFTDYCEPIDDGDVSSQELISQMVEYGKKRKWKYIELRGGHRFLGNLEPRTSNLAPGSDGPRSSLVAPSSSSFGVQPCESAGPSLEPRTMNLEPVPKVPRSSFFAPGTSFLEPRTSNLVPVFRFYLGHTLDLSKREESIFSSLRDSTRRNIKKAKNQGVEIKISRGAAGVSEFYKLNCMTRRQHGLPPQPYHFFQKVYDHIISRGLGFVALASHGGRNIAGAVFLHFGGEGIYKYGASDMKFQDLRANNLVMWEAIRWLSNNGYKNFRFGRTELENEGLRQFKNGWGTDEYLISYFKYDVNREVCLSDNKDSERTTRNIFSKRLSKRMPIPILNLAGSLLYRHMG